MNINMEHKNIVATIYLKDGKAIKARDNYEEYPDVIELAKLYNDSVSPFLIVLLIAAGLTPLFHRNYSSHFP